MTDMIDLSKTKITNSPVEVRTWPATTDITSLSFGVNGQTRVEFTKRYGPHRWPDVFPFPETPNDPIQFTLWLFLKLNGVWVGSGFQEFWNDRDGTGSSGDPDVPSVYHEHWYYGTRWTPMEQHGPIPQGEPIAFMVTSGDARDSKGPYGPKERSNVVVVAATDSGSFTFGSTPVPPDPPTPPTPVGPPYSDALSVEFGTGINAANEAYKSLHGGANIPYDPGMISVHSQRAAFDYYAGGMAWEPCKVKHLNEYRAEYGLPPV